MLRTWGVVAAILLFSGGAHGADNGAAVPSDEASRYAPAQVGQLVTGRV